MANWFFSDHLTGKEKSLQQVVLGQLNIYMQKTMKSHPYLMPYTKIKKGLTNNLNIRTKL